MAHDSQSGAKISGYLEKKGKLRMVSSWKKYWFVLEGRLLLYYRSKAEYDGLGPCKGSITLGTPCNIKPALASSCIFQIETRASTATLRAENRYEQDKWMQAILGALNQTTANATKMSHFRYSADDLVPTPTSDNKQMQKPVFSRQNTMPERLTKGPQKDKTIIERLQTLGAHTYGGSLQTINKIASKISPKLPKNENLKRYMQNSQDESCVTQENSLYAQVDKAKLKTEAPENSHYTIVNSRNSKESETIIESNEQVVIENENYASSVLRKTDSNNQTPTNENRESYGETARKNHIYQEISEASTTLVENSEYCSIDESNKTNVDHNENNVDDGDDDNSTYSEPIYTDKIYDLPFNTEKADDHRVSRIYEEPQLEPELPPRPIPEDETSSQSSCEQKPKKPNKIKKLARLVSDARRDGLKRNSFVIRMLRKIRKSDGGDACTTEAMPSATVVDGQNEIQVLNHLQKLLDDKKHVIEEKIKTSVSSEEDPVDDVQAKNGNENEKTEYVEIDEEKDTVTPTLPPKHKYTIEAKLDYAGFCGGALNIPRPKLIQKLKKHRRSTESVDEKLKTIDEILDDLDSEKREQSGRQKVKLLIEKFNVHGSCEEVEMRKKYSPLECEHQRHSDDLNRLLAELSKVTNAPILTPGVTSSLITTPLTSDEWKNLVPIRKRRFSEPDYDIPRPHSSLQIIPTFESKEKPMKPTRFFGPVLIDHEVNGDTNEKHVSITPDSLEIEQLYQTKLICTSSIEEDRSLFSYTSHNYGREMKTLDKRLTREEIYSRPKSLTSPQQSIVEDDVDEDEGSVGNEMRKNERYEDSLEPVEFLQNSTEF